MFFHAVSSVSDLTNLTRIPANNMFLAYFTALESAAGIISPFKGVAKAQAEVVGFVSRRAQAMMEVPSQLSVCRNPQELLKEQMAFWTAAAEHYNETSRRILEAWGAPALASSNSPQGIAEMTEDTPRTHDYIEFPVAKRSRRVVEQPETRVLEFA